jgi:hypothetical protein
MYMPSYDRPRARHCRSGGAMADNQLTRLLETDGDILDFDISDDELERTATVAEARIVTLICTQPWYRCGWPQ